MSRFEFYHVDHGGTFIVGIINIEGKTLKSNDDGKKLIKRAIDIHRTLSIDYNLKSDIPRPVHPTVIAGNKKALSMILPNGYSTVINLTKIQEVQCHCNHVFIIGEAKQDVNLILRGILKGMRK